MSQGKSYIIDKWSESVKASLCVLVASDLGKVMQCGQVRYESGKIAA